jgi:diacylglycerol kinase family enzyme
MNFFNYELNKIDITATKSIHIKYKKEAPFYLDGESIFTTSPNLAIKIIPEALNVIC